ncbi:hypothetical protein Trydic_g5663 [Trypoxylus dichotomus]
MEIGSGDGKGREKFRPVFAYSMRRRGAINEKMLTFSYRLAEARRNLRDMFSFGGGAELGRALDRRGRWNLSSPYGEVCERSREMGFYDVNMVPLFRKEFNAGFAQIRQNFLYQSNESSFISLNMSVQSDLCLKVH